MSTFRLEYVLTSKGIAPAHLSDRYLAVSTAPSAKISALRIVAFGLAVESAK